MQQMGGNAEQQLSISWHLLVSNCRLLQKRLWDLEAN